MRSSSPATSTASGVGGGGKIAGAGNADGGAIGATSSGKLGDSATGVAGERSMAHVRRVSATSQDGSTSGGGGGGLPTDAGDAAEINVNSSPNNDSVIKPPASFSPRSSASAGATPTVAPVASPLQQPQPQPLPQAHPYPQPQPQQATLMQNFKASTAASEAAAAAAAAAAAQRAGGRGSVAAGPGAGIGADGRSGGGVTVSEANDLRKGELKLTTAEVVCSQRRSVRGGAHTVKLVDHLEIVSRRSPFRRWPTVN